MRRYSIWGREYGADHDVELAQVDGNPQPVLDGLASKMLTIKHSVFQRGRQSKIRKYTWLRIVDHEKTT
jgi:hypothetical protein